MQNIRYGIQILLYLLVNVLFSQEIKELNDSSCQDSIIIANQNSKKSNLLIEAGINVSGFQNINSEDRFGYSYGLTFSHNLTKSLGISLSLLLSRQNIYTRDREAIYEDDMICYRRYYDIKGSYLFLEFPTIVSYKLWEDESTALYIGIGRGLSLKRRGKTKRTNYKKTNEIVIPYPCYYIPVDEYYYEESSLENSGLTYNAGLWFTHKKFIFKILYINKRYQFRDLDKLHLISIHFGYNLNSLISLWSSLQKWD